MAKERRAGERIASIPVDDWNEFVRTAKWVKERQSIPKGTGNSDDVVSLACQIVNKTGAAITADRPVLAITKVLVTIAESEHISGDILVFEGETPDATTRLSDLVIVEGPVPDDQTAGGVFMGITWAEVEFDEGEEGLKFAAIKDGDNTQLKAASSGIPILWKDDLPDPEYLPGAVKCVLNMGGGGGGAADILTAAISGTISSGSAAAPTDGVATAVYRVEVGGTTVEQHTELGSDDLITLWNPFGAELSGSCTVVYLGEGEDGPEYLIVGPTPTGIELECVTQEFVTDWECIDGTPNVTKEMFTIVVGPCAVEET